MRPVFVLNGPNLNLLGQREPDLYGRETLADVEAACAALAAELRLTLRLHQSNREYELIDWVHEARTQASGIVINPGGYGHTSVALMDALAACACPVLEVHITNIFRREAFRHHSYVSQVAAGVISGFGTDGYLLALRRMAGLLGA